MPRVELQHLTLLPGSHPKAVRLALGDSDDAETAQVWIEARFPFQGRPDDKLAPLAQDALRQLQTLIDEGIMAAQAPPSGNA